MIFLASIQVATIPMDVINESGMGTGESVNFLRRKNIKIKRRKKITAQKMAVVFFMEETTNSPDGPADFPLSQKYQPYILIKT
jgi:hypothetical protein